MLAVYDVCRVEKTDDKYLKIMSSVPNAEKYDLFTVDNVLFVPLDQVYDMMTRQPDPDTVSRQKTINTVNNLRTRCDNDIDAYHDLMIAAIEVLPPSPSRPHGEWLPEYGNPSARAHYCSVCKFYYTTYPEEMNYCPHCGAKMEQK